MVITDLCICGHTRDWHFRGDALYQVIFGQKLGECNHKNCTLELPIWKRHKRDCDCKEFRNKDSKREVDNE